MKQKAKPRCNDKNTIDKEVTDESNLKKCNKLAENCIEEGELDQNDDDDFENIQEEEMITLEN